jgi:TRAP-type mannitol/chloroaromatic compound transport system substrate-binding protein
VERRRFLVAGAAGAAAVGLSACNGAGGGLAEEAAGERNLPRVEWDLVTSWPASLDTIFGGAVTFADRVAALSGGRFTINAREGGELVPALEVLQAVQSGGIPAGHTAGYYYVGLSPVTAFSTSLPFGLTCREQNAWLYEAGGLEMLQEFYADTFNVIQFPAGNTGAQMGGWFNRQINSLADLRGLRMRTAGLTAQVLARLGVTVQTLPGGEIFQALQTGALDAAEWVGPYDDLKLDFPAVARYYYYPGWWEPGPSLEVQIGLDRWTRLPSIYQDIIKTAAKDANLDMMARYDFQNPAALREILSNTTVELRPFPQDVMDAARTASFAFYEELAARNPRFREIYSEWNTFRESIHAWFGVAEREFLTYVAQPPS